MKWSKWYHLQNILQLLYKSTTCSFSLRQFKILVCDVRKRVGGVTRTWEDGWNEYYVFSMFKDRRVKALLHREKTQEKYTAASYWIYWTMKTWSCCTKKRITKKDIAVYIYIILFPFLDLWQRRKIWKGVSCILTLMYDFHFIFASVPAFHFFS